MKTLFVLMHNDRGESSPWAIYETAEEAARKKLDASSGRAMSKKFHVLEVPFIERKESL